MVQLGKIGFDIQADSRPLQTVITGPSLEVRDAGRCLRRVIRREIGPLVGGKHGSRRLTGTPC